MRRFALQHRGILAAGALGAGLLGALVAAGLLLGSHVELVPGSSSLTSLDAWVPGARIESASAYLAEGSGHDVRVPLSIGSSGLFPAKDVPPGVTLDVTARVHYPAWISWLAGSSRVLRSAFVTPQANVTTRLVQTRTRSDLDVSFSRAVLKVAWTMGEVPEVEHLPRPTTTATIHLPASASTSGVVQLTGDPDSWESFPPPSPVFYTTSRLAHPMVAANPSPGSTTLSPSSRIELTFSEPAAKALDGKMPVVNADLINKQVPGTWEHPDPYSMVFVPTSAALWPGEGFNVELPDSLFLVEPTDAPSTASSLSYQVAPGSVLRLQQMLASLGYLPVSWSPSPGAPEGAAPPLMAPPGGEALATNMDSALAKEDQLAYHPPAGTFSWRWNTPPRLQALWQPGIYGVMTKGAVMNFEKVEGLNTVGRSNPLLWPTLARALVDDHQNPDGYSWVDVSKALPEHLTLWHDGQVVLTSLANTGIAGLATPSGTFPVYLRLTFQIMRGTNPDGTPYADPVHWINYFYGSDAVHGFVRASYGFPQSLGCVELPVPTAAQVWPYLHIGSLVTVHS